MRVLFLLITLIMAFAVAGLFPASAHAEFIISSAIVEFNSDSPQQQDIELISRAQSNDYISVDMFEVLNPGEPNESRQKIDDPTQSRLLVTPDKVVLGGEGRKILRFVMLQPLDDKEHIYRVAVKPEIKGVNNNATVGLKILVGYEVLVIVRPKDAAPHYSAARHGAVLDVTNNGNTNILFQGGEQCDTASNCKRANVARVYAGQTASIQLPMTSPVTYTIWDGKMPETKMFN